MAKVNIITDIERFYRKDGLPHIVIKGFNQNSQITTRNTSKSLNYAKKRIVIQGFATKYQKTVKQKRVLNTLGRIVVQGFTNNPIKGIILKLSESELKLIKFLPLPKKI